MCVGHQGGYPRSYRPFPAVRPRRRRGWTQGRCNNYHAPAMGKIGRTRDYFFVFGQTYFSSEATRGFSRSAPRDVSSCACGGSNGEVQWRVKGGYGSGWSNDDTCFEDCSACAVASSVCGLHAGWISWGLYRRGRYECWDGIAR